MYSADADFFLFIFFVCVFLGIHRSTGPNWTETQSQTTLVSHPPPPPPTHHDLMKIYWVYRYLHQQKYTLLVDLHVNFVCVFLGLHRSTGPNWSEIQPLWVTPPPHINDLMKIYRVYRYQHQQQYTLFVDLHVYSMSIIYRYLENLIEL